MLNGWPRRSGRRCPVSKPSLSQLSARASVALRSASRAEVHELQCQAVGASKRVLNDARRQYEYALLNLYRILDIECPPDEE